MSQQNSPQVGGSASRKSVTFSLDKDSVKDAQEAPPRPRLLTPLEALPPSQAVADALAAALESSSEEDAAPLEAKKAEQPIAAAVSETAAPPAAAASEDLTSLKSAIKQKNSFLGVTSAKQRKDDSVYCDDCKEYIPAHEWPNHRDRLRSIQLKARLSGLQKYLVNVLVDFVMWVLVNIYFREVAVVGADKVPKVGPVVFYGNHQNQFIDAMMIRAHCGRRVRFIIAEKSMSRPIIGHFARMMEAVPVIRPQDVPSLVAQGKIVRMAGNRVFGEGTAFLAAVSQGDVVSWAVAGKKERCSGQVLTIVSDTELTVTMPIQPDEIVTSPTPFKFSRRIDHSEMYADVYSTLAQGESICIFPEGGSHDRTSLLPLKAGVALFSLGAYERGIHPQIVPCGLTYFYGHKFRSRAHIEFGEPLAPNDALVHLFTTDKRKATGQFLDELRVALQGVTINVADWGALKFLHAFRRLYQPPDCMLTTGDYLKLTRRLACMMEEHDADPQFADFRSKVENYCDYCSALLVRDSQAATLEKLDEAQGTTIVTLLFRRVAILVIMLVVLIPFFFVAAPIGIISHFASEHHARTALSTSSVKVVAADVKGSFKIIVGFAMVPLEVCFVSALVWYFTGDLRTAVTIFFSLPMAMYVSLLILQESILEMRAALPLVMSLFSKHKQFKKLYDRRQKLVDVAKTIVKAFDPALEDELAAYKSANASVREPSLFSLRHSSRRLADKMK